jgi:hypothetical protein
MRPYTVFVNSTDAYADTWDPFFDLFAAYGPPTERPVLLNTETKGYRHPAVDVVATRVGAMEPEARLSWGECLLRALDLVETDLLLYLQDDYFLEAPVQADRVDRWARRMLERGEDNIRLLECGGAGPWSETDDPLLWEVDRRSRYRVSLQAGLWRVDTLRALLRSHESPWQFEAFGSRRARRGARRILCVNRDRFHRGGPQVVPYTPTGIVGGRWDLGVVEDLFTRHGIAVDYATRGVRTPDPRPAWRRRLARLSDRGVVRSIAGRLRSMV